MNKPLANAILGVFHLQPAETLGTTLAAFPVSAWRETYRWLDGAGLALYFLDRLQTLGLEASVPVAVQQRLGANLAHNRERTTHNFAELVRANRALAANGITFVNLKGFASIPDACEDPGFRLQLDLDVLVELHQMPAAAVTLGTLGYVLIAVDGCEWQFQASASSVPTMKDLYRRKPQRSIDLHFETEQAHGLAQRREWVEYGEFSLPVLGRVERFMAQAKHVLKHLRGEWTRLSWLLEFRHSVLHWKDDVGFWREVRERAAKEKEAGAAIGAAIVLATMAFGEFASEDLTCWTVDALDAHTRMWLDRYSRDVILAEFPGTKLYLLQPHDATGAIRAAGVKRRRLVPLRSVPRVAHRAGAQGWVVGLLGLVAQVDFMLFRLRFHAREGLRYLLEAPRWKKALAAAEPQSAALLIMDERGSL
jgi:hypothetical protein